MDSPPTEPCPVCGGMADLTAEVRPMDVGGRTVEVPDEFYRCRACSEEYYHPGMLDAVLKRAVARVREEDALLTPDQVRGIRQKLGLTQPQFECLLGVGANTVVRWERGTVPQGSAADSLLRLLDALPENARFLADLHGVDLPANGRKARTKAA
jgi:putative zinc finger/helix-turn-helix YgiT family protein